MRYCLLIILFMAKGLAAQEGSCLKITCAPASLLDFSEGSNLKLGLEAKINRFALSQEGGIYFGVSKGVNLRTTLKYYDPSGGVYFGLQYFYKDTRQALTKGLLVDSVKTTVHYHILKYVNSVMPVIGVITPEDSRVRADIFFGAGMRHRNNSLMDISREQYDAPDQDERHLLDTYPNIDKKWVFDFVIGCRIFIAND